MCFFGGGGGGDPGAEARAREEARAARISQGQSLIDKVLSGFNDAFYAGREKAYMDYAAPQIDSQFKDARKGLLVALARAGLTGSSTATQRFGDLDKDYSKAKIDAADKAKAMAADARGKVERTRSDLYSQLFASADPTAAANAAAGQASVLGAAPAFSAVGPLFQNVGAGIGAYRAGEERARINDILSSALNTGSSGSYRVVG